MAKCHLGVVLFAFNNSGVPTGATFNIYTADNRPMLKLNFRDVDDAKKGVVLCSNSSISRNRSCR